MQEFIDRLLHSPLLDVLIGGYVESRESRHFSPFYTRLYFFFEEGLFELRADGHIEVRQIDSIEPWFEVEDEDEFCTSSVFNLLFKTDQEIVIEAVDCHRRADAAPLLLGLDYRCGEWRRRVHLDPLNFFGFSFFDGDMDAWQADNHHAELSRQRFERRHD